MHNVSKILLGGLLVAFGLDDANARPLGRAGVGGANVGAPGAGATVRGPAGVGGVGAPGAGATVRGPAGVGR